MLKLKLKRKEIVFIEIEGKTLGLFIDGYGEGGYHVCLSGPREFQITRDKAKNKNPKTEGEKECLKPTF